MTRLHQCLCIQKSPRGVTFKVEHGSNQLPPEGASSKNLFIMTPRRLLGHSLDQLSLTTRDSQATILAQRCANSTSPLARSTVHRQQPSLHPSPPLLASSEMRFILILREPPSPRPSRFL